MSPRRAFGEAFATVIVPSIVIWGAILFILGWQFGLGEDFRALCLIILVCAAIPCLLFFPIYDRYRKGVDRSQNQTPKRALVSGFLMVPLSIVYAFDAFHRRGWDRLFHFLLAFAWVLASSDSFRKWHKLKAKQPTEE